MAELIDIEFLPTGKTIIKTDGFTGEGCIEATKELTARFGGKQISEQKTKEYFDGKHKKAPTKQTVRT